MKTILRDFICLHARLSLLTLLALGFGSTLFCGTVSHTYMFEQPELSQKDGYDYLVIRDCVMEGEPKLPLLPMRNVRLLLPSGEQAFQVETSTTGRSKLGDGYRIYPAQYDVPVSKAQNRKFTHPDAVTYASAEKYPQQINTEVSTGFYRGHSVAILQICPVEYYPATGEVYYYTSVTVSVTSISTAEASISFNAMLRGDPGTRNYLHDYVDNPEQLGYYPVQADDRFPYDKDYLIITAEEYSECFTEFVRMKRTQGLNTEIVTTQYIYSHYSGVDNQEKIRNCIKDYYQNYHIDYVLLGGDVEIVPHRNLFGHYVEEINDVEVRLGDQIPSDLYYGALDRVGSGPGPDWNVDNDDKWGEYPFSDPAFGNINEADFMAEVSVGRISADSITEFNNALNKQILYQKRPVVADNNKAVMVGQKMWDGWCGDEHMEQIRLGGTYDDYTTHGLVDIGFVSQLQYAHTYPDSTWPVGDLVTKLNSGTSMVNHLGHGNTNGFMEFNNWNGSVDLLTSDGRNHNNYLVYSQTCYGSAFDNRDPNGDFSETDCMTEFFTTNSKGVLAVVGNSRFGFTGSSNYFHRWFIDGFCKDINYIRRLGDLQKYSKGLAGFSTNYMRWVYYELNLFGDPALELWRQSNLNTVNSVNVLTTPYVGMTYLTVEVSPPVAGFDVAVCTDSGLFGRATTNSSGNATIYFNNPLGSQSAIYGMVTKENYYPQEFMSGWFPSTWTGNYSNSWNDSRNWLSGQVPNSTKDVVIPTGYGFDPLISTSSASCRSLTMEANTYLTVRTYQLSIAQNASIRGSLNLGNSGATVQCAGNVTFRSGASCSMASGSYLSVSGNISDQMGLRLTAGTVIMNGSANAFIYGSGGKDSQFWNLTLTKANASVTYGGEFTGDLVIKSNLSVAGTSILKNENANNDVIVYGNVSGTLQLDYSTFTCKGSSTALNLDSEAYVNDFVVSSTGTVTLNDDLVIKGNLQISAGVLNANEVRITLHGNWNNTLGQQAFAEGTSIVEFLGSANQTCSNENFHRVILNKSAGYLQIASGKSVLCDQYDWAAGTLKVQGGSFEAIDVLDTGIQGNYQLNGGSITLQQDAAATVDMNCNITIDTSGTMRIKGGNGNPSRWAYLRDAQIIMTGGTLDFTNSGITMANYGHLMSVLVIGGTIRTVGSFTIDYGDFSASGGTLEMYGTDSVNLKTNSISELWNLSINKTTEEASVTVISNTTVLNDVSLNFGTLKLNNATLSIGNNLSGIIGKIVMNASNQTIYVAGDIELRTLTQMACSAGSIYLLGNWTNKTEHWASPIGFTLYLEGIAESVITSVGVNGSLGNLVLAKDPGTQCKFDVGSTPFLIAGDVTVNDGNLLRIVKNNVTVSGTTLVEEGGQLQIGSVYNTVVFTTQNLSIYGTYTQQTGTSSIQNGYTLQSSGELLVHAGSFVINSPYSGTYYSFAGSTTLYGGSFQITNNGIQFGAGTSFTVSDANVKVGWGVRCSVSGVFTQNSGTFELIGSRSASIDLASGNYFHNLMINKSPASTNVYLGTNVTVDNDLDIQGGYLIVNQKVLTVNNDVKIIAGRLVGSNSTDSIVCGRHWFNSAGALGFSEGTGSVTFTGSLNATIQTGETFYKMIVSRSGTNQLKIGTDVEVVVLNDLQVTSGTLSFANDSSLSVQGILTIQNSGRLYTPVTSQGAAITTNANVNIQSGGSLQVDGINNFTANSTFTLAGSLLVSQGTVIVHGEPTLATTSSIIQNGGTILFDAPDNRGWLMSYGSINVSDGQLSFPYRNLQFVVGSSFAMSGGELVCGGNFYANAPDVFAPEGGLVRFEGNRTHSITCSNGNMLPGLTIDCEGGSVSLGSDLSVLGDLLIWGGSLYPGSRQLYLYGSWQNDVGDAGFSESGSTVTFVGSDTVQIMNNEKFANMVIARETSGQNCLVIPTAIAVQATGNLSLQSGAMRLLDSASLSVSGDISIADGAGLNLAGMSDPTYLYIGGNLLDMNNVLDTLTGLNTCGVSHVTFNGTSTQNLSINRESAQFQDLSINKPSGAFIPMSSLFVLGDFLMSSGSLNYGGITNTHEFQGHFTVQTAGHWMDNYGTIIFSGFRAASVEILGTSEFGYITIDKSMSGIPPQDIVVTLSGILSALEGGVFNVDSGTFSLVGSTLNIDGELMIGGDGVLSLAPDSQLRFYGGSTLNVNNGGRLISSGSETLPVTIGKYGSSAGFYTFNVNSGGFIAAEHTIFEFMDANGVNVKNGALVSGDYCFTACTFRNGISGGVMLTLNNAEWLVLNNVVMPTNIWGGWYNVRKDLDQGSVRFNGESGEFSWPFNENDPYGRISWSSEIPLIQVNASSFDFGDVGILQQSSRYFIISNPGTGNLIGTINTTDEFLVYVTRGDNASGEKPEPSFGRYGVEYMVFPGSYINVEVRFRPQQPISYNATIVIEHNAAGDPAEISVTGNGIGPSLSYSPAMIHRNILPNGNHSEVLTISNTGNESLTYYTYVFYPGRNRNVLMSEGFESGFPPTGWDQTLVMGSEGWWYRSSTTVHPYGLSPHGGSWLAYFNSYTAHADNHTRLFTSSMDFSDYMGMNLSFWMYHDLGYPSSNDCIQIQVSVDGGDWQNLGDPIYRYVPQQAVWLQHNVSLAAYSGQSDVKIGFLGISYWGNDIHIDDIEVTGDPGPNYWVSLDSEQYQNGSILPAEASDQFDISIDMDGMDPGHYTAQIFINSNDPMQYNQWIPVEIDVGTPEVMLYPTQLSFGNHITSSDTTMVFSITATGDVPINGTITAPDGFSVATSMRDATFGTSGSQASEAGRNSIDLNLMIGQTNYYAVTFSPVEPRSYNGDLQVSIDNIEPVLLPLIASGIHYPSVLTSAATDVHSQSAVLHGEVVSTGNLPILERGFRYATHSMPFIEGTEVVVAGTTGPYQTTLGELFHTYQYYYCAYATNSLGTDFGQVMSFTTATPHLETDASTGIDFGAQIINTASDPSSFTISGYDLVDMVMLSASGGFELSESPFREGSGSVRSTVTLYPINGILPETTIYVRFTPGYAIDYNETIVILSVGAVINDIPLSGRGIDYPTVLTLSSSDVTPHTAMLYGELLDSGNDFTLGCGFCWNTTGDPDIDDDCLDAGVHPTTFSAQVEGLESNTTYYFRAWSTNNAGTGYGEVHTLHTEPQPVLYASTEELPDFGSIRVGAFSDNTSFTVQAEELTSPLVLTAYGDFEFLVPGTRLYSNTIVLQPENYQIPETQIFTRFVPQTAGPQARHIGCVSLGADSLTVDISGTGIVPPTIHTLSIEDVSHYAATVYAMISNDGYSGITQHGICYSAAPEPGMDDYLLPMEDPGWEFSRVLSQLSPGTTYYVRAYAINAAGVAYGEELSFATQDLALIAPPNMTIWIEGDFLYLSWNRVESATGYVVQGYDFFTTTTETWSLPQVCPDTPNPCLVLPLNILSEGMLFHVTAVFEP